eukprot:TRINITY_DN6166_c0_g1_i2.p2 TRINITY_DN6166_c0_g1~~TRINITY_DN6166_c0_g1_i2.p2  ORF type:complete len:134 (-),score=45.21 TRINITY_DN6166_c0_g1_i2:7-408(-)
MTHSPQTVLAERELPALSRHCAAIELHFSMFATQWFMCLFVLSLPSETAFRVWDRVLCHGPAAIFETALRALRLAEKKVMAMDDAFDALVALNEVTANLYDADSLFQVKLKQPIDNAHVRLLRAKFRADRLKE